MIPSHLVPVTIFAAIAIVFGMYLRLSDRKRP